MVKPDVSRSKVSFLRVYSLLRAFTKIIFELVRCLFVRVCSLLRAFTKIIFERAIRWFCREIVICKFIYRNKNRIKEE